MTSEWRQLDDHEITTWPKARMGGALLTITIAIGAISLALLIILIMLGANLLLRGPEAAVLMLFSGGASKHAQIGMISGLSMLILLVGALILFTLTLFRAPATPAVAAAGGAILFVTHIVTNVAIQWLAVDGKIDIISVALLPMIPQWIGSLAATAGFAGYMLGGVRPNAYFRRRVAVPAA